MSTGHAMESHRQRTLRAASLSMCDSGHKKPRGGPGAERKTATPLQQTTPASSTLDRKPAVTKKKPRRWPGHMS